MPSIAEYPTVAMDAEARSVTSNVFEVTKGEHFQINSLTPYQAAERSSKRKVNNRKNCVKKYSKLFIIVGGLGAILLMCIVCFELLQKISNNERQINAVLQKINQLSEDNRRLELKVRRLQVRMTSHHEQMTSQGDVFEFQARRRRQVDPPKHGQHPDAIIPVPDRARNASFPVLSASRALRPHQEVVPLRPEVRRRRKAGGRGNRKCKRQTIDRQRNKRAFRRLPWIKLSGPAKERPGLDMPSGNFIWKPKSAADLSAFGDYSSSLEKEALLIRCPGAYYVFADIRLNGRRFEDGNVYHPYIGIELVRKSFGETEWNILTRGYITQDNLGFSGGQLGIDARPVDTFGLRDLVSFECGDEVKVRLVEGTIVDVNNDQFLLTEDQAQFGMFMVEEHGDHCPLCSAYS